jgi:CubicO group peptidase (beta-lactamase class C family)
LRRCTPLSRRGFNAALGAIGLALLGRRAAMARDSGRTAPVAGAPGATHLSNRVIAGQVAEVLRRHLLTGYLAGAVALIGQGESAEVVLIGHQSKETGEPMRRDSIFRIASMTKPVTAAAALIAIEHALLRLNEPVSRWLPELDDRRVLRQLSSPLDDTVRANRPITVEDLLTSRAGLGIIMASPDTYPIQRRIAALQLPGFGPPEPGSPLTPDQWLKRVGTLPLMAQPGEQWLYNTSSCLLGVLLERLFRRSLPEVLEKLIFEPLGMRDTGFFVPDGKRERLVSAYRPEAGRIELYDSPAKSAWGVRPPFPDGAAGLVSTADDYFAFSHMMLAHGLVGGGRLLSEASTIAMTSDHLTASQRAAGAAILGAGRGWGIGMSVVADPIAAGLPLKAYGWNGGLGTSWIADPNSGLTAILLTQTAFTSPAPPRVHEDFWRAVFSPAVL